MRHFISAHDIKDISEIFAPAFDLKRGNKDTNDKYSNKILALVFFHPNIQMRVAVQKAAALLGLATVAVLVEKEQITIEKGWQSYTEKYQVKYNYRDLARMIGLYCDAVAVYVHPALEHMRDDSLDVILNSFVRYAGVPVINLGSTVRTPLQSAADLLTIEEFKSRRVPKVTLCWIPDSMARPHSMANSFLEWSRMTEIELTVSHPPHYRLSEDFMHRIKSEYDQKKALEGADLVYALNWTCFKYYGKVVNNDSSWKLTAEKMRLTNHAYLMSPFPLNRSEGFEEGLPDTEHSLIWQQLNNYLLILQVVIKRVMDQFSS